MKTGLLTFIKNPAGAATIAAIVVWAASTAYSGGIGATARLSTALAFSTFVVIVGLGQMLVITLGPGNIDLSVPATMTLAGVISMSVMQSTDSRIALGLLVAILIGLTVGVINYGTIKLLSIPPIIATMSMNFLVLSTAIATGRGLRIVPPDALADFSTGRVFSIPILAIFVIGLTAIVSILLSRTILGRSILAIGQNMNAAYLSGVPVELVQFAVYTLSGGFAGLCGVLLASFSGGGSLNIGEDYLLSSIAVVVVGGTSVMGGKALPAGLWAAGIFLFLLTSMLNTFGVSSGVRLLVTGIIIISVILLTDVTQLNL